MRISRIALLGLALSLAATVATVDAAERVTLDRHGAWVSVEAYGPNVVHVTMAADKAQALAAPGYGILADHADGSAFKRTRDAGGDTFASPALTLHVDAPPPPRTPAITDRYFAPQLAPVSLQVKNASGATVVDMTGWEMSPHEVAGEATYQVGATFTAPADEHYYGMGQNQDSLGPLDLRGRVIDCKHWYDAPSGETVCVPFMVSS
ncbi:MAG TPA: alpha-glucosidase, partial [Rhodanobacter sp.]|nr:alpha-glucosidase [Rhodanobacter sp.]